AFFPLYPLTLGALARLGPPPVLAGVLISTVALALALYGLYRLTALEFARRTRASDAHEVARLAVLLMAFAPMALFLSAVFSEALFLALSIGLFLCARRGRWAAVGALGALAGATRSTGVVLIVPALLLYLYGPREDGALERTGRRRALAPRYPLRRDALWLALAPAGLLAYIGYFGLAAGDPLAPFQAGSAWGRHFAGPFGAIWDGSKAGFDGLRQLLSMQSHHVYFTAANGSPTVAASHDLINLAFLAAAAVGVVGVLRTLPLAYGAYVLGALAVPLSYPARAEPLMSLPRYMLVLFPLQMWLAGWLAPRPRARAPVLVASALLLVLFTAQFSTWH
ncbi:MAG TPA: mannosyltransferase family protein, partial [Solirubrobacteraceae bacterium]|nr:mannosyltransferase family protein [Solirubrobacteraceae bacterium]